MNRITKILLTTLGMLLTIAYSSSAQNVAFSYSPKVITGNVGDTVNIRVIVKNFNGVSSFQYTHSWDTTKLKFVRFIASDPNPLGLIAQSNLVALPFSLPNKYAVTTNWQDVGNGLAGGVTLAANDSILYGMTFRILSTDSWLNYYDQPTFMEIYRSELIVPPASPTHQSVQTYPDFTNIGSGTFCKIRSTALAVPATCTGSTPNSNASIKLTGVAITSARATFSGQPYSSANCFTTTPVAGCGTIASGNVTLTNTLPNPAVPTQYTVRLYRAQLCFKDTVVTLNPATCSGTACPTTSYSASTTPATCTGTTANSDARICITNINAGATAKASFSVGATYTGPAFANAPNIPNDSCVAINLANPATATTYTVRVFRDAMCFKDTTVTLNPVNCGNTCTPPSFTVNATSATCAAGTTANSNASLQLFGYTLSANLRVAYSVGTTYSGPMYSAATAVPSTNFVVVSNLSNPASATSYTVRLFTSATCFSDRTVVLQPTVCGGPNSPMIVTVVNDSAAPCGIKCVDVKVSNFNNIAGFQFNLKWNPAKLKFSSIQLPSMGDTLPNYTLGNFGTVPSLVDTGRLTTSFDYQQGATVPNGTTIFRVCFLVKGNGGDTAKIDVRSFSDSGIEAYNINGAIGITPQPGTFKITGTGSGSACSTGLSIFASAESAVQGDLVCVKVKANNFNAVTSLQYAMKWNSSIIKFQRVNVVALTGLGQLTVDTVGGIAKLIWSDQSPTAQGLTLPNGTTLYEVCYKILGSPGQSSNVTFDALPPGTPGTPAIGFPIEITGNVPNIFPYSLINGKVTVINNSNTGFQIKGDTVTVSPNGTVCVPIRVRDFINMVSMSYTMTWDTNIIKLDTFIVSGNGNPIGLSPVYGIDFGSKAQAKRGRLGLVWTAADGVNGKTVPNGTMIYQLCFKVVGNLGSSTPILFVNSTTEVVISLSNNITDITSQFSSAPGLVSVTAVPLPLAATSSVTNLACNAVSTGVITLNITGGRTPYTFDWADLAGSSDPQNRSNLAAGTYSVTVTDALSDQKILTGIVVTQPNPILTGAVLTPSNGSTGAITLNVTGGTSPFTYDWQDLTTAPEPANRTGLAVGTYTVTITDGNGCKKDTSYRIVPGITIVTDSVVSAACFGTATGAIYISIAGSGTPPYRYDWSDLAGSNDPQDRTGLAAGTYTVTVIDVSGGGVSQTFTVTEPTPVVITVTGTTQTPNGTVNITVAGGTPPYTYQWTGPVGFAGSTAQNLTGLNKAGTYTVTVRDAKGCIKTAPAVVAQGTLPINIAAQVDSVSCFGAATGRIIQTVTDGCAPFSYAWSVAGVTTKDLIGVVAGNYSCTITDVCGQSEVRAYTIYSKASAALVVSLNSIVCESGGANGNGNKDGKIYLNQPTGGTTPYSYNWQDLGPNDPMQGSRDRINNIDAAKYTVIVTDKNGCSVVSDTFTVPFCPFPLNIKNIVTKPVNCFGGNDGQVKFDIEGGHPVYSISWGAAPNQNITSIDGNVAITDLAGGTYAFTVTFNYKGATQTLVKTITVAQPTLALKIDTAIIGCAQNNIIPCNGSIDISVSGGTFPYSYNWDNGTTAQDLITCPGVHKVTVTDIRGCILLSSAYTVGTCIPLTVTGIVSNVKCSNGTDGAINITVNGGSGTYTTKWDNGAVTEDLSGLAVGIYKVTVYDAANPNALGVATFTVGLNSTLNVAVSVFGTSASVAVTGGVGNPNNYTYKWSIASLPDTSFVTGLSTGIYSVTVVDSLGCSKTAVFTVDASLTATVNILKNITCFGDCDGRAEIANVVGGATPYIYNWDNGSTGNGFCAGNHTVTVTDAAGRKVVQTFTIAGPSDSLRVSVQTTNVTVAGGADGTAAAFVSGGTAPFSYQWNDLANTKTPLVVNLPVGDLAIIVKDKNGCSAIAIGKVGGIGSECFESMKVFTPNNDGLNDKFLINLCDGAKNLTFQIFNRWGQLVHEARTAPNGVWEAWDGKDQSGTDLPEGGYFYVLDVVVAGKTQQYKGSITLLR